MTRGHRGGKGGLHSIGSMNEMNSMESMEDGILEKSSQGNRSAFWWGRELGETDFRDPPRMQELYERVRDHGFVGPGEQDRIAWFALLVHYGRRRKLRNRSAVLTALVRRGTDGLKRPWRAVPTADDEDTARRKLRELDHPRATRDESTEMIAAEFGVVPDEDGFFSLPMPDENVPEPEPDPEPKFVSQIPAAELERLRQAYESRKQSAISPTP